MPSKFANIQKMIDLFQVHHNGLGYDQLKNILKVDIRTVKRYLSELRANGYQVIDLREAANRPSRFKLVKENEVPSHLIPTLKKIKEELNSWGNPKFGESIGQVLDYLQRLSRASEVQTQTHEGDLLPKESSVYNIDHGPFSEEAIAPGRLKIIETAIKTNHVLKIQYSGYQESARSFEFYPYKLSLRVGTLYLIGREGKNAGIYKSLSLKRISRLQSTSETFKPAKFKIENYYKYCFGQFSRQEYEKPVLLVLKINEKWVKKFLSESHFNPPGKLLKKEGVDYFHLQIIVKPDLINWILSLYPYLVPVKPEKVVQLVQNRLNTPFNT